MAYTSGEASTLYDVFEALDTLLLSIGWVQHNTKYTTGSWASDDRSSREDEEKTGSTWI